MRRVFIYSSVSGLLGTVLVANAGLVGDGQLPKKLTAYTAAAIPDAADAAQGPSALNNLGNIIGKASRSLATEGGAIVWTRAGAQMNQVSALAGSDYRSASAINDKGDVTGVANTDESIIPFIWTTSAGVQRIPLLPGDNCGQSFSINKHGNVVGYSSGPNGVKAFLWTAEAGVRNLGTLFGGSYSRARDINDSNEIVGTVKTG